MLGIQKYIIIAIIVSRSISETNHRQSEDKSKMGTTSSSQGPAAVRQKSTARQEEGCTYTHSES